MNMKHSKISQSDLDKFVPSVLFQEQSDEQDKQAEREIMKSGEYMQHLRTEPKDAITSTQAESICEKMLIVREYNSNLPF